MTDAVGGGRLTVSTEVDPPEAGTIEARASLALKVLAIIHAAGIVLALIPLPISTLFTVSFHSAAGALAVLYVVTSRAIDRRRPWAIWAVRPMLVVLVAAGICSVVLAVNQGQARIPFDAILGVWALTGRRDSTVQRRPDLRTAASLGAMLLGLGVMLFGRPVFDWGGVLDPHEPDLVAAINVDCGPSGAGLPASIAVRYDWSWAWRGPLPSGFDTVVIGWTGDDAQGRPLYTYGSDASKGKGIYPGRLAEPSITMAKAAKEESDGSWQWGVELGEYGFQPGDVELGLTRAPTAPQRSATLTVVATYLHLGVWRSDAVATCTW